MMTKIRLLSTVEAATKASHQILISCGQVGLSCVTGRNGCLAMISVCTGNGDVYVFDVKGGRDVLFDGGVTRILQSPEIVKVMHDCEASISAIYRQHGIQTQNVFDTQLAFSTVLETEELPGRKLPLNSLCEQSCIAQYRPSPELQKLLREDSDVWMRRPVTFDVLNALASTITPLYPELYNKLTRILLARGAMDKYEKLNKEGIQTAINQRKVTSHRNKEKANGDNETTSKYRNKQGRLTTQQRLLLSGMMPVIIQEKIKIKY